MKADRIKHFAYISVMVVTWFMLSRYTFNPQPDLNGDNFNYYTLATSIAQGHGYSDLSQPGSPATAIFPPGYPVLMAPLRLMTDSVIAQKWLNELFVLFSILLLYFLVLASGMPINVAFTCAYAGLFCPRLWHFSTMMMSEASFLFFSVLALFALFKLMSADEKGWNFAKDKWFYILIITVAFNYHIRTQGLALLAGTVLALLLSGRWRTMTGLLGGFAICALPWIVRNNVLGLDGNRYLDTILLSNPWRPEEGSIGLAEFVKRFFETLRMLVFNAIPNTIVPFVRVDPDMPQFSVWLYILGIILVATIIAGFWQLRKIRWALIGYVAATLGLISVFSTPSGSRYITSLLPLLMLGLFLGLWFILQKLLRLKWKKLALPALVLLPLLFLSKFYFVQEHTLSNMKYPEEYQNFFQIGEAIRRSTPEGTVICSRKPGILYFYSEHPQVKYPYTTDAGELIRNLISNDVSYVLIDNLGYSSTYRYLIPAVMAYPQYFSMVMQFDRTATYLFEFDKEKARQEML